MSIETFRARLKAFLFGTTAHLLLSANLGYTNGIIIIIIIIFKRHLKQFNNDEQTVVIKFIPHINKSFTEEFLS